MNKDDYRLSGKDRRNNLKLTFAIVTLLALVIVSENILRNGAYCPNGVFQKDKQGEDICVIEVQEGEEDEFYYEGQPEVKPGQSNSGVINKKPKDKILNVSTHKSSDWYNVAPGDSKFFDFIGRINATPGEEVEYRTTIEVIVNGVEGQDNFMYEIYNYQDVRYENGSYYVPEVTYRGELVEKEYYEDNVFKSSRKYIVQDTYKSKGTMEMPSGYILVALRDTQNAQQGREFQVKYTIEAKFANAPDFQVVSTSL